MAAHKLHIGPRGGKTTVTDSWRRTTVYLEPAQIRLLKQIAIHKDTNVSEILRRAIDVYVRLDEGQNPRLTEQQRRTLEKLLQDIKVTEEHLATILQALADETSHDR